MEDQRLRKQGLTRRDFLERSSVSVLGLATLGSGCSIEEERSKAELRRSFEGKTVLSFYCDDTNPYVTGVSAFKEFLDFISERGLAGESSVILGYAWDDEGLLSSPETEEQKSYIKEVQRAYECGVDTNFELMTHSGLFDFETRSVPPGAQHEGVWLHEPSISQDEYENYFSNILAEGEKVGIQFTGVTWPGCGCNTCEQRYGELIVDNRIEVNPNVWKALLSLISRNRFRGKTIPCFVLGGPEEHPVKAMAQQGEYGVFDLYPAAEDKLGIWENDPAFVDADYYISADGSSGRIVEKVNAGASHCVLYSHWQGLNPATGVGWAAFKKIVKRIEEHLSDRVVWMRPSAFTDLVHSSVLTPTTPGQSG